MNIDSMNNKIKSALNQSLNNHPNSDLNFIHSAISKINGRVDCFISNSLPIRFFDNVKVSHLREVYVNRGASGIDGNIAGISSSPHPPKTVIREFDASTIHGDAL